jgi:hypothetical protein
MKPIRIALVLVLLSTATAFAQIAPKVEVFKSASCGCCGAWVEHMRQNGFQVIAHDVGDVPAERKKLGMPDRLGSCHSAKVGGYVIEGHVPAADIRRLLKEKPKSAGSRCALNATRLARHGRSQGNPLRHAAGCP